MFIIVTIPGLIRPYSHDFSRLFTTKFNIFGKVSQKFSVILGEWNDNAHNNERVVSWTSENLTSSDSVIIPWIIIIEF